MPSLSFLFIVFISNVIGAEVRINSVDKLKKIKDNVDDGTTYSGTTVLLDSDLSSTGRHLNLLVQIPIISVVCLMAKDM